MSASLRMLPLALTLVRAALGPIVVALAFAYPSDIAFAACLLLALLSDYFDGVIARRLGIATPNLRRMDSIADSIFYVSAFLAAWHLHSELLRPHLTALVALVALEITRYIFDYKKFGKEASYHMWSSKAWGLALFIGFFSLLVYDTGGWPVSIAIYLGIAADLEGLAISVVLSKWRTDVPSLFHAFKAQRTEASGLPDAVSIKSKNASVDQAGRDDTGEA